MARASWVILLFVFGVGCSVERNSHLGDASIGGNDGNVLPDGRVIVGLDLEPVAPPGFQHTVVHNNEPRLDSAGQIIDAHDGQLIRFGDRYYLYGTTYGESDRRTNGNEYSVYGSSDLMHWTLENAALLHDAPTGVYYRPHVIYNEDSERYVLWYTWSEDLPEKSLGVAVARTPTGPFEIIEENVEVSVDTTNGVGDSNLFVDDDGTAYVAYASVATGAIVVDRLTPDYLRSSLESSEPLDLGFGAPILFRRGALYYLLTDIGCDFCDEGTGSQVYTASSPLGPYSYRTNINRELFHSLAGVTNGDRRGTNWEHGGGWNDDTSGLFPDWVRVDFDGPKEISSVDVFTLQDEYLSPAEPTRTMTFELHGLVDFDIQTWDGEAWDTVPGGSVRDNDRVWVHRMFTPITTTSVRVRVLDAEMEYSRVVEMEAWEGERNVASAEAGGWASASSEYGTTWLRIVIPAQQTYVAELPIADGNAFVWMADMWNSGPEDVTGHDYQYWSAPLTFDARGHIAPMVSTNRWEIDLVNARAPLAGNFTNMFGQSNAGARNDRTGYVGYEIEPEEDLAITALGRAVSGSMNGRHEIRVWSTEDEELIASATVTPDSPTDWLGYKYARLDAPVILTANTRYRIGSQETEGGDCWMDLGMIDNHAANVAILRGAHDEQDGTGYVRFEVGSTDQGYGSPTFYTGAVPQTAVQQPDQDDSEADFPATALVAGRAQRLQTFTSSATTLSRIDLFVARGDTTDGPLVVQVVALDDDLEPVGTPLFATDIPANAIGTLQRLSVYPNLSALEADREYGIVLKAPGATQGGYVIPRSDGNPYIGGLEQVTAQGGLIWIAAGAGAGDIKFTTYR